MTKCSDTESCELVERPCRRPQRTATIRDWNVSGEGCSGNDATEQSGQHQISFPLLSNVWPDKFAGNVGQFSTFH